MDPAAFLDGTVPTVMVPEPKKDGRFKKGYDPRKKPFQKGHDPRRASSPGMPSTYTQEVAQIICERIANGESIHDICKPPRAPGIPSKTTVFYWRQSHEDFARAYALAKQCYAEDVFDKVIAIADNCKVETAALRKAKLRIETMLITAARLHPRRYGVSAQEPLLPQALPPSDDDDGEDAVVVEPAAERHPLYDQMVELQKVVRKKPA